MAEERVRETRRGEARVREWERKASQRGREAGKRRVARRWRWVICAAIEWSLSVFFVVVSVVRRRG